MRRWYRIARLLLVCLVVFMCRPVVGMQAGAAKVEVELPANVPLAGHAYRQGRSAEVVLDGIYARCLYLDDDQFDIAVVSLDIWGITPELRSRILELAPDGLDPEAIIVVATGNHSGPGGLARAWDLRQHYGRYMPSTIDALANGAVAAIEQAIFSATRATIGYRIGNQESLTRNSVDAEGPRDREVGVIRVDDSDGNPIAIVGTLSASVDTLGREHALALSADFPGVFCNELETLSSEGTVALFLNGASGDQRIAPREDTRSLALAQYVGKELAVVVKGIANTITCDELPMSVNFATVKPPSPSDKPYVNEPVLIQTLEVGDLLVSFALGAPVAAMKQRISNEASRRGYGGHILVSMANENLGVLGEIATPPDEPVLMFGNADWMTEIVFDLMRRGASQ